MRYCVDQIIDDISVLENMDTLEIIFEEIKKLPYDVHEGSILDYIDGVYYCNNHDEELRLNDLRERFNKLKRSDDDVEEN